MPLPPFSMPPMSRAADAPMRAESRAASDSRRELISRRRGRYAIFADDMSADAADATPPPADARAMS